MIMKEDLQKITRIIKLLKATQMVFSKKERQKHICHVDGKPTHLTTTQMLQMTKTFSENLCLKTSQLKARI